MDPHVYIRERADELAVAEQKSLAREPITLGPGNQGDRKKFMQALYGKGGIAEEKAALVAKYEEELDTHEERMLGQFMVEKWVEATWIARLQQFPDGRPYNRQTRLNLTIWGVFLEAIEARQMAVMFGGAGNGDAGEAKVEVPIMGE